MKDDKTLYILDGHALAYRAYFAMIRNPLTNSKGQPTSVVFGFANYLLRLLQEYQCPYLAVAFDSPKPSFRKDIYKEYKANREEMPDDMKSQIPLVLKLVECFNIPYLMKESIEADDIIAYLTRKAEQQGFRVFLVTRDKDLMQLVSENVHMLTPETGGTFTEMGPVEVNEKMGVPPQKILDLLALMGDTSDNIPGIPGVGPKTAIKILEKAGSLENLLADTACVGNPKLQVKINENIDKLNISRELVTLKYDIGIDIDIGKLKSKEINRDRCIEFFTEMEFNSLLKNPLFDVSNQTEFACLVPEQIEDIAEIVSKITAKGTVSIDTETTGVEARIAELVGISLAIDDCEAWYIPLQHDTGNNLPLAAVLKLLQPMIESEDIKKTGQNLKYDYQIFKNYGITMRGISFDTLIAAYLIEPGKRQYNMDSLAVQWLNVKTISIESLIGKKGKNQKSFSEVPIPEAAEYSGEDAVIPLRLMEKFRSILEERDLIPLFETVEMPLVTVLAEMEWCGIKIDTVFLQKLSREYSKKLEGISRKIYNLAGEEFNLNSPKQISEIFFTKLGLPKSKKTKTGLSTDVNALAKLAPDHPIAEKLLEYREVQKLLSTYIDALPTQVYEKTGRVHTSFNQTITATGRLSSTSPNLQNIPIRTDAGRRIREAFIAPEGRVLISADYSQIELRILAHLSKDERLIQAFQEDRDIHTQTASAIYDIFPEMVTPEMRRAAKTINFGLMYGMGPKNLSRQLSISFKEAQTFIDIYFEQFPTIRRFMESSITNARKQGYSETLLGRRRYLPDINASERRIREAAERTAINTPVQGTAADIIKIAMVNIQRGIGQAFPGERMLLQVHDELVFEVADTNVDAFSEWVVEKMSSAYSLVVPLKVDIGSGKNWSEAH